MSQRRLLGNAIGGKRCKLSGNGSTDIGTDNQGHSRMQIQKPTCSERENNTRASRRTLNNYCCQQPNKSRPDYRPDRNITVSIRHTLEKTKH